MPVIRIKNCHAICFIEFFIFSGKDIEIALTELRELQNHIDTLMVKDKKSKSEIQELLETKYRLEK